MADLMQPSSIAPCIRNMVAASSPAVHILPHACKEMSNISPQELSICRQCFQRWNTPAILAILSTVNHKD